jgi:Rrf2 family nitric oxide-sensitive transcriptional repressor
MKRFCYSRYALQVLFHLAVAQDQLCKIGDVAAALHIPVSNLSKLVVDLAGAGYIRTIRGRGGGITLGPDAGAIRIGDIIRHIEGEDANLFEGRAIRADADDAQLGGVFSEAIAAYFRVLDGWSVADLLAAGPRSNSRAPADRDQPRCWRVRNSNN